MQDSENLTGLSKVSMLKNLKQKLFLFVIGSIISFYIGLVYSILLYKDSPCSLWKTATQPSLISFFFSQAIANIQHATYFIYILFIVSLPPPPC